MYLDLTCPLELLDYELLRDDHNKVRAYLGLNNLSGRRIERIEGDIVWIHAGRGEQIRAPFIADQLRAPAGGPFKLQLSTDYMPDADQLELVPRRIGFAGGAPDWEGDEARMVRIEEPLPPPAGELNRLVAAAGVDARNFPLSTAGYWVCVCGRPNQTESPHCARCQRQKGDVLESLNRRAVLSGPYAHMGSSVAPAEIPTFLDDDPEPSPEQRRLELTRQLRELHAQYVSQRNLLIRRSIFLAVLVAIVLLLVQAFSWLGEKQQQARDIRPPVKTTETAAPEINP